MSHDGVVEGGRISCYFHTILIGKLLIGIGEGQYSKGEKVCMGEGDSRFLNHHVL